jgi:hypothetical protein
MKKSILSLVMVGSLMLVLAPNALAFDPPTAPPDRVPDGGASGLLVVAALAAAGVAGKYFGRSK